MLPSTVARLESRGVLTRLDEQQGATAVEYSLMALLVAVVVISAVAAIGLTTGANLCAPVERLAAEGHASEDC